MADQTVTLRITANTQGLVTGVELAKRETRSLGDEGQAAGQKLGNGVATARAEIERTGTVINQVKGFVGGLAAAFVSVQTVRAVTHMADEWSDLTSLVKVNIGATENANAVMERLTQVARGTYSSLRDTAQSFAANATTLNALGKSTQEQLDYTTALNNALVISGAKGEQFAQVQDALSKAMATGSLRGEELNTVLGRGSAVAEALAAELGTSALELRKLGADGKITGDVIFTALVRRMGELEERAESMPATIGDAFTVFRNALLSTVGYADNAAGATNGIAEAIIDLADVISRPEVKEGFAAVAIGAVNAAAEVAKLFGEVKKLADFGGRMAAMKVTGWLDPDDLELLKVKAAEYSNELLRLQNGERSWTAVTDEGRKARIAFLKEEIAGLQDSIKAAQLKENAITAAAEEAEAASKKAAEEAERQRQASLDALRAIVTGSGDAKAATDTLTKAQATAQARLDALAKRMSANARAAADFRKAIGDLAAQQAGPLAVAERAHQQRMDDLQELLFEGIITYDEAAQAAAIYGQELDGVREQFDGTADAARELEGVLSRFDDIGMGGLVRDIRLVEEALLRGTDAAGNAFSPEQIERMQRSLGYLKQEAFAYATDALGQGIQSLKGMASEGSKAYAALEVAQTALNLATAIGAIANQGMGDPYTAFARIAAMAAMMSQLVDGLGAVRGGFSGGAEQRQATQGTGTVLGDTAADSRSIARGVDITASATQQLVGINRSMLHAMQSMAAGLSGASTLLARGAGGAEFAALGPAQHNLLNQIGIGLTNIITGGIFGGLIESVSRTVLGARNKITDTGILIGGGLLSELLQGITVGAYQESQSRSWWFGSTRTSMDVQSLGDDVAVQFQLVLDSMADAVRSAAQALGMDLTAVNAAIAQFEIEEIRISTMDLSAEEAQAELEAVFSAIFDGLAAHVVPFVSQFQRVGEGLGETLVRVATSVQVIQEAVLQLGIALDETDPERLAQISVGLVDLMGGIEEFIAGMTTFVSAFAPESHKFSVAQDALTRAFEQFGLAVPDSRDAMWELMQGLDATTAAGREQIAMLLQLADVSDAYYTMLEDRAARMAAIDEQIADGAWQQYLDGLTAAERAIAETTRYYDDWTASLIVAGATAEQLAAVEEQRAVAMERLLAAAEAEYQAQVGNVRDMLDARDMSEFALEMRDIHRWTQETTDALNDAAVAAGRQHAAEEDLALVHAEAAARAAAAIAKLRSAAASLVAELFGPAEGSLDDLNARIAQLEANSTTSFGSVSSGIDNAVSTWLAGIARVQDFLDSILLDGNLTTLTPEQQLAEAQRQYDALLAAAQGGDADALSALPDAARSLLDIARGFWSSGDQYQAIFDSTRAGLQSVAGMAGPTATGTDPGYYGGGSAQVSSELAALYAERDALLAEQEAAQRAEMIESLGGMIRELIAATGEPLADVAASIGLNLSELADSLGINLNDVSVTTAAGLVDMARMLGVDVAELAQNVGVSLGALGAEQSLLNEALKGEIDKLPEGQRDALQEYFDNIVTATSEADANEAINAMAGYINSLDADIRNQLAPFFDDIDPTPVVTELTRLSDLSATASQQLTAALDANQLLRRIAQNSFAANEAAGLPAYAAGGWVNGPTALLAGEAGRELILPNPVSEFFARHGIPVNAGGGGDALAGELRALREEVRQLRAERRQGDREVAAAAAGAGDKVAGKIEQQTAADDRRSRELIAATERSSR